MVQLSHDYMDLCWQSDVSAFNTPFRLVIAFLPRSKRLLILWLQSPSAVILEPPQIKSHGFYCFLIFCHQVIGLDAMILVFWMLSFKSTFSLSFHFHQSLFSSSSLSAIRVVTSAYLRLLIFLSAVLIPACASSSLVFLMMYSAYKLNKLLSMIISRFIYVAASSIISFFVPRIVCE